VQNTQLSVPGDDGPEQSFQLMRSQLAARTESIPETIGT
jgi:hypothetical protein